MKALEAHPLRKFPHRLFNAEAKGDFVGNDAKFSAERIGHFAGNETYRH
jgi:hypothetical protein